MEGSVTPQADEPYPYSGAAPDPGVEQWRTDKNGRQYLPRPGGGMIFPHSEDESAAEARVRDQLARGVRESAKRGKRAKPPRGKGRKPDPTPPGEKRAPPQPAKATAEQLAAAAELPLLLPMLFARYAWGCEYCANNFKAKAPDAARDLVQLAVESENVYLLRLLESWQRIVAALLGGAKLEGLAHYAIPPVLHHIAPEPMLNFAGPMLGVPPRPARQTHQHRQPGPRHAETSSRPQTPRQGTPPPDAPPAAAQPPTPAGMADVAAAANGAVQVPPEMYDRLMAGDPDAHRQLAEMARAQQQQQGQQADPAEAARAREVALMAEREQLRSQLAQKAAMEQMARRGPQPNVPPYSARNGDDVSAPNGDAVGPGPRAPAPPDGASSAGNPLPPEANDV